MSESPVPMSSSAAPALALPRGPQVGDLIGRYRIRSIIQQGGMGEVFLVNAIDDLASTPTVLKRLPLHGDDEDGYAGMFRAETDVMSRLRHDNIVSVLDSFETDGEMCLALEFIRGRNLLQVQRACAEQSVQIPPGVAAHIIIQVLEGLHYAHTFVLEDGSPLRLVHRDVTPGNILVGFDGTVKITDFGIAKSVMSRVATRVGVVKGTTRYLSPEQIRARDVTPRSDIFSASVVLTELLSGKPLFDRGAVAPTLFAIVNQERPDVAQLLPVSAPELAFVLEGALATDADRRPVSAAALAEDLRRSVQAQGWDASSAAVKALMARLFPESVAEPDQLPATIKATTPRLDLTYLLEVSEPNPDQLGAAPIEEELRALLQGMIAGASPLDASQFDSGAAEASNGGAEARSDSRMLALTIPAESSGASAVPAPTAPPPVQPAPSAELQPARRAPPPVPPPDADLGDEDPAVLSADLTLEAASAVEVASPVANGEPESQPTLPPLELGAKSSVSPPPPPPADKESTPREVRSRDILDALDHVSSEIDALEKSEKTDGSGSEQQTIPGATLRSSGGGSRWLRDAVLLVLGLGLGIGGTLAAPTVNDQVLGMIDPAPDMPASDAPADPASAAEAKTTKAAIAQKAAKAKKSVKSKKPAPAGASGEKPLPVKAVAAMKAPDAATTAPPSKKASKKKASTKKAVSKKAAKPAKRGPGMLTVTKPRGARVYIDGFKLKRRVPLKKVRVKTGKRRVVKISKRGYLRVFEVDVEHGVHLDVTGGKPKVVASKTNRKARGD